ncbi:hypothetical protein RB195_018168 [Necator americanus]|uniref:ribonuclease H n=1 Tax=Necator americanus TaxID=51031 RepID=A0ABR1CC47_NECAM
MAKSGFYAVAKGRKVGIYTTWDQCRVQVDGYPQASDEAIWEDAPVVYTDGACSGNGQNSAKVKFEYVPGHSGVDGNEAADELARRGAEMYRD